jgi:hypothetical protein
MKVVASCWTRTGLPPRQRQRQNHTRESHAQTNVPQFRTVTLGGSCQMCPHLPHSNVKRHGKTEKMDHYER